VKVRIYEIEVCCPHTRVDTTSVFQTVIAHLHTLSIQVHSFLDDSLIRDFDQQTLVSQTEMVI
jgi:hypothetical protein